MDIKILKLWIKYGHLLGNHTYSHLSLSDTELEIFKKDVIKGTKISTKLIQYFAINSLRNLIILSHREQKNINASKPTHSTRIN